MTAGGPTILLTQALFGEVSGSVDELGRSGQYPTALALSADLPEPLPAYFAPQPHLSVRLEDDWVGFMATAMDAGASREGMVRTHLLAGKVDEVATLDDIGVVLERLDPFVEIDEVTRGQVAISPRSAEVPLTPGALPLLVSVLTRVDAPTHPVVWVGVDTFPTALRAIWSRAPLSVRRSLSVRLGLKPRNLTATEKADRSFHIVVVPTPLRAYWMELPTIDHSTPDPEGAVARYLRDGEGPAARLLEDMDISVAQVESLEDLERAAELWDRVSDDDDKALSTSEGLLLAELVDALAPHLAPDQPVRVRVVAALRDAAAHDGGRALRQFRTFDSDAFEGGAETIRRHAETWAQRALAGGTTSADTLLARLCFTSHNQAWNREVQGALQDALAETSPEAAETVLSWWKEDPELIAFLSPLIPESEQAEASFSKASNLAEVAELLIPWTAGRCWAVLHALAARHAFSSSEALRRQIAFEGGQREAAIRLVAQDVQKELLISVAVETVEPILIKMAAAGIREHPEFLERADLSSTGGQQLWKAVLESDVSVASHLDRQCVYSSLLAGQLLDDRLVSLIFRSEIGDVSREPDQERILSSLPDRVRRVALRSSADSWRTQFRHWATISSGDPPLTPMGSLEQAIASGTLEELLPISAGLGALIKLARDLPSLSERVFIQLLQRVARAARRPHREDVVALGRLVRARRWVDAGRVVREIAAQERSYGAAIAEFADLFPPWEGLLAVFHGPSPPQRLGPDEWWGALEALLCNLYPKGLSERSIVERAGGDLADFDVSGSGREQWARLVRDVRYGATALKVRRLLRAVKDQFPVNKSVASMIELHERHLR